ncbi:MAG: hypothetical protein ACR2P3_09530 [Geminicoccaceae bacterium]
MNRETPIGDLHRVIADFDRRYPDVFDDDAIKHIINSRKNTEGIVWNLAITIVVFIASSMMLQGMSEFTLENVIALSAIAFAAYMSWKSFTLWRRNVAGKQALERCVQAADIPAIDLRDLRDAYQLIHAWREGRTQRKHGKGPDSGGGGSTFGGCGSSGCGGGGGGCGGGD